MLVWQLDRAQNPGRNVASALGSLGPCPHRLIYQTRRPRHPFLQAYALLAYAAASEGEDALLALLPDQDIGPVNETILLRPQTRPGGITSDQVVPCRVPRPQSAKSSIFPAGEQVDIAIPFSGTLSITDREVSAALHARPLLPGAAVHCQHWGTSKRLVHGEIGLGRVPGAVARHKQDRRTIRTALATLDGLQVRLEHLLTNPHHGRIAKLV
jgi:hypothetical protein